MNTKHYIPVLLLAGALISSKTTFAQQPALAGSYTLTDKSQISGTEYGNAIPAKLQFAVSATEVTLTRTEVGADEDTPGPVNTEKLTLEKGKVMIGLTPDKSKFVITAKLDGATFNETKTISQPGQEAIHYRIQETNTLSADGKSLTLVKEFENLADANDKWSVKGTYQKQ